jgi:hypothetical protein
VYNNITLHKHPCPHGHSTIFTLENFQHNDVDQIFLSLNGEQISTGVSKYKNFPDETIMSLQVWNENAYIRQWISYHHALGVSRFIIYDNYGNKDPAWEVADKEPLSLLLQDMIQKGLVILIDWPYSAHMQQTQQTHSVYAFRDSQYIGFLDVDEYVNPQGQELELAHVFASIPTNPQATGGYTMLCKIFSNPGNQAEHGFDFLQISDADEILPQGREKVFVVPRNVKTFSVHMITSGSPSMTVDHNLLFFNHYMFLNKQSRARGPTHVRDDSILHVVDRIESTMKALYYGA